MIGKEVDDAYMAELKKQVIHLDAIDERGARTLRSFTHLFTEQVISRQKNP